MRTLFLGGRKHGEVLDVRYSLKEFYNGPIEKIAGIDVPLLEGEREGSLVERDERYTRKTVMKDDHLFYTIFFIDGLTSQQEADLMLTSQWDLTPDRIWCRKSLKALENTNKEVLKMMKEAIGIGPSGRRGKYIKGALMMAGYGAGLKTMQKKSGLGLRQIKIILKMMKCGKYSKMLKDTRAICQLRGMV